VVWSVEKINDFISSGGNAACPDIKRVDRTGKNGQHLLKAFSSSPQFAQELIQQ